MSKKELIKLVKKIDITQDDWCEDVFPHLTDYQHGYLRAKCSAFGEYYNTSDEEYREEMLEVLDYLLND